MIVNRLLVRWADGYTTREDTASIAAAGRAVWGFLSLPDVRSLDEVDRICTAEFDRYASEQVSFALTVDPRNGPVPFVDYDIGDTVLVPNIQAGTTLQRVSALDVSEDTEGVVGFAVEVGEQLVDDKEPLEYVNRWLKRMAPGTLSGRSEAATPILGKVGFGRPDAPDIESSAVASCIFLGTSGTNVTVGATTTLPINDGINFIGSVFSDDGTELVLGETGLYRIEAVAWIPTFTAGGTGRVAIEGRVLFPDTSTFSGNHLIDSYPISGSVQMEPYMRITTLYEFPAGSKFRVQGRNIGTGGTRNFSVWGHAQFFGEASAVNF